ncbi:hypothetical protein FVER14953_03560 [Fusarium verticillioides]|nr:hypothetical protein FVER14953_03560 [Fusarium verticillioides]
MAAMAVQNPPVPEEKLGVPSRNPLPLSASQEAQVRDIFYQKVRKECADEIKGTSPQSPLPQPPTSPPNYNFNIRPLTTSSIRRMRPRPHIHRLLRLPRRTPLHEQLHEAARHTIRTRRGTRGVVRPTNGAPARTRAKSQSSTGPGGVYAGVVGIARARAAVEAEGDGAEGGEDTWTYGEG